MATFAGQKFRGVHVVDQNYLMVHFVDDEVVFNEIVEGDCAYSNCSELAEITGVYYGDALNHDEATEPSSWKITSKTDANYGTSGDISADWYRKSQINGMAQHDWVGGDYEYETTMEHWIYLALPSSLVQGSTYTVEIASSTNTDVTEYSFTYDIYGSRSEAVHVNLAGYHPSSAIHAADLYHWMGDGGARDYSAFEGNSVYLYDVETKATQEVGNVSRIPMPKVATAMHWTGIDTLGMSPLFTTCCCHTC